MTIQIPANVRFRSFAGDPDLAEIVRIENADLAADGVDRRNDIASAAVAFGHPSDHFDPRRDVTIAEYDGVPVAFQTREWVDTTDGLREYRMDGAVDPAWRRRGIGGALVADGERRSRALAAEHATSNPRVFGSWASDKQAGDAAVLTAAGYQTARWFFEMTRTGLDDVPDAPLPDGLEIRRITPDLALQVWRADVEAFRDHWGGFDGSDERLQEWLARPSTDLSLWVIAFDGDEVAAGVLNTIDVAENEALGLRRGWLSSVFTRRAWRRRGLARALIVRSLVELRERGMASASLGVDADNPSGALGLYEGVGFRVETRSTAWRKAF